MMKAKKNRAKALANLRSEQKHMANGGAGESVGKLQHIKTKKTHHRGIFKRHGSVLGHIVEGKFRYL